MAIQNIFKNEHSGLDERYKVINQKKMDRANNSIFILVMCISHFQHQLKIFKFTVIGT